MGTLQFRLKFKLHLIKRRPDLTFAPSNLQDVAGFFSRSISQHSIAGPKSACIIVDVCVYSDPIPDDLFIARLFLGRQYDLVEVRILCAINCVGRIENAGERLGCTKDSSGNTSLSTAKRLGAAFHPSKVCNILVNLVWRTIGVTGKFSRTIADGGSYGGGLFALSKTP